MTPDKHTPGNNAENKPSAVYSLLPGWYWAKPHSEYSLMEWLPIYIVGDGTYLTNGVSQPVTMLAGEELHRAIMPEVRQPQSQHDTCPACKGEGFGPVGGRPGTPCGECGTTGKING